MYCLAGLGTDVSGWVCTLIIFFSTVCTVSLNWSALSLWMRPLGIYAYDIWNILPNIIIWIIRRIKFPVQVLIHGLLPKPLHVSMQCVYVCWVLGEKRLFSSITRIYLQAGTESWVLLRLSSESHGWKHYFCIVEGSGCLYNYYGTLIIGKERLCGQLPSILLKLMKSFTEDLLIFQYKVRAKRPLFINF